MSLRASGERICEVRDQTHTVSASLCPAVKATSPKCRSVLMLITFPCGTMKLRTQTFQRSGSTAVSQLAHTSLCRARWPPTNWAPFRLRNPRKRQPRGRVVDAPPPSPLLPALRSAASRATGPPRLRAARPPRSLPRPPTPPSPPPSVRLGIASPFPLPRALLPPPPSLQFPFVACVWQVPPDMHLPIAPRRRRAPSRHAAAAAAASAAVADPVIGVVASAALPPPRRL